MDTTKITSEQVGPIFGPYAVEPGDELVTAFRQHVLETNRPEIFPGIYLEPMERDLEHRMLTRFEVVRKNRIDGEMVPCSICSAHSPKFTKGVLIWSNDGWLRLLGHDCGRRYLGRDRFDNLHDEMRHKQKLQAVDQYLIEHYAKVEPIRNFAGKLREVAFRVRERRTQLRRDVSHFCDFLDNHQKQGHGLPLYRSIKRTGTLAPAGIRSSTGGSSDEEEYWENAIRGMPLIRKNSFDPVAKLDLFVKSLPPQHASAEGMKNYVFGAAERVRISQSNALETAIPKLKQILSEMNEAVIFLTTPYLNVLQAWLAHPDCRFRYNLSYTIVVGSDFTSHRGS